MPASPLTHHEILGLVEPFTRRGRHVDLAASNRLERRLFFKPVEWSVAEAPVGELRETLRLDSFGNDRFRLTRTLTLPNGLHCTLEADGPQPGKLLADVEAVAIAEHLRCGPGYVIARSYSLPAAAATRGARVASVSASASARLILTRAVVKLETLTMTLSLSSVRGIAATLTLTPTAGRMPALPEDLLAVLGWDWARLVRTEGGWETKLRLRGNPTRRSRSAEKALDLVARHLAQTLTDPPARFHDRWRRARWGVVMRRSIPLLTAGTLLVTVSMLPHLVRGLDARMFVLFFHVPTALIALSFCLQELPRFEIPSPPRRSAAPSWDAP